MGYFYSIELEHEDRGTDPENITPELKALLEFVETPTEEVADQKTFEIAARLKDQGLSVEMIAAGTGLSRDEIEKL